MLLINFPNVSAETLDDAGRQLDRMRQDMERQRIQKQINEDINRHEEQIEIDENKPAEETDSDLKFLLTEITADESEIITAEVLGEIAAPYLDK